jgi:hypothetical protein
MPLTPIKDEQRAGAQFQSSTIFSVRIPCHIDTKTPGRANAQRCNITKAPRLVVAMPAHVIRTISITIEKQKVEPLPRLGFYSAFQDG